MVCLQSIRASCRCGCCCKSPSSPWEWETGHPFQAERKCQGEGLLGCSGRQDGWVGPLHEQASQAVAEDIRHPQEQVQVAQRDGRKEAQLRGIFSQPAPRPLLAEMGSWPAMATSLFVPGEHMEKHVVLQDV